MHVLNGCMAIPSSLSALRAELARNSYLLKLNSIRRTSTVKLATFQRWNPGYHSIEASPQHPLSGVGVCGRAGVGVASTGGLLYLLKLDAKVVYLARNFLNETQFRPVRDICA